MMMSSPQLPFKASRPARIVSARSASLASRITRARRGSNRPDGRGSFHPHRYQEGNPGPGVGGDPPDPLGLLAAWIDQAALVPGHGSSFRLRDLGRWAWCSCLRVSPRDGLVAPAVGTGPVLVVLRSHVGVHRHLVGRAALVALVIDGRQHGLQPLGLNERSCHQRPLADDTLDRPGVVRAVLLERLLAHRAPVDDYSIFHGLAIIAFLIVPVQFNNMQIWRPPGWTNPRFHHMGL